MRRVIWKGIWAHKIRLVLVSTAIMLGVAFVAGSFVLTGTVNRSFDDLFASVYKDTDVVVRGQAPEGPFEDIHPPVDASLVATIAGVEGVTEAQGFVQGFAQLTDKKGNTIGSGGAPTFGGNWSDSKNLNPFRLTSGTAPGNDNEVVIDAASAKKAKYAVGDELTVLTAEEPARYKISGIAKFGEVDSPGGATYALFTEARAHQIFNLEGKYTEIPAVGASGISQEQLRDRIAQAVGPNLDVQTGAAVTKENQDSIKSDLSFFTTILLVFAAVSLFVGAFVINNVFAVLVAQRTKELALLRALGARGRQVRVAVLVEALVVGIIASLLGLGVGVLLAKGVLMLLEAFGVDMATGSLVIGTDAVVASLLCGVIVTLISSYFPARKASRVPPLAAMRDVSIEKPATIRRLITAVVVTSAGVVALGAGLFSSIDNRLQLVGIGMLLTFVGVAMLMPTFSGVVTRLLGWPVARLRGVSGVLARENAARTPRRTSATAAALMIGVALITLATTVFTSAKESINASIDKSFAGDFVVEGPQFSGGLPVEIEQQLGAIPGVAAISPVRYLPLGVNGSEQFAAAIDPVSFKDIYDVKPLSGDMASLDTKSLAVSENYAKDHNWQVGQTTDVRFTTTGEQQFEVGAIFEDPGPLSDIVISTAAYDANITERFDSSVFIALQDGVNVEQARPALEKAIEPYPNAKLRDSEGLKENISEQIDTTLNVLYGFLGIAIIIALLGVATTLALAVFERTHEIGLLRAVGMSRRQLRSSINWEAAIVAVFGTLLGLALGIGFAAALVDALSDEGFDTLALPYVTYAVIVLLAALAAVIAAFWPAMRASRQNVLNAIATT